MSRLYSLQSAHCVYSTIGCGSYNDGQNRWQRRLTANKQRILWSTKWQANPWPPQQLQISEGLQVCLHFRLEERGVKVESGRCAETSVDFCRIARLHNPRGRILQVLQVLCRFQCPRPQAADVARHSLNSMCSSLLTQRHFGLYASFPYIQACTQLLDPDTGILSVSSCRQMRQDLTAAKTFSVRHRIVRHCMLSNWRRNSLHDEINLNYI